MSGKPLLPLERHAWTALLLVAFVLRVAALGDRPFHHDESIHAWAADHLAQSFEYKYDPVYHGPVQYFAVASSFLVLGSSDFSARFPAALGGTALVALAFLLRRRFGPAAAFAAGALLAFSPSFLYYSRFCREDVWSLLGTAGLFVFFDEWLATKRISALVVASLACAVAFGSKENFFVLLALLVPSVAAVFWEPGEGIVFWPRIRRLVDFLEAHQVALAGALCIFFVVSELLYTLFLVHPESGNPAFSAISYWWGQHTVERVPGPKTYYLPRILQYEFALLIPAFLWLFRRRRTLTAAERFLGALGLSSLAMYAYLGEKTPWLIVHQVLPFVPIAALAWAGLFEEFRSGKTASWKLALGQGVIVASLATALTLTFLYPNLTPAVDKAESVIYVQTTPELKRLVSEVERLAAQGASPAVSVDGQAAWPLSWYFRKTSVDWGLPRAGRLPPVVIVDPEQANAAREVLGPGYREELMPLRAWWLVETSFWPLSSLRPTPRQLLDYLLTRTPWSPIGAQNVTVFRKEGGP